MDSVQIRNISKELLRGRFSLAIVMSLAVAALSALVMVFADSALILAGLIDYENGTYVVTDLGSKIPVLCGVLVLAAAVQVLFGEPIKIGVTRWFFALCHGKYLPVDSLFFAFSKGNYASSVSLSLRLFLRLTLWSALLCLPGLIVSGGSLMLSEGATEEMMMTYNGIYSVGVLLFGGGFVAARVICLKYFLAMYLFVSAKDVTAKEAVKASVRMMKGRKHSVLRLSLSFIPHFLLAVVTIGLTLIHTVPRLNTSLALCAKGIIEDSLKEEEAPPAQDSAEGAEEDLSA